MMQGDIDIDPEAVFVSAPDFVFLGAFGNLPWPSSPACLPACLLEIFHPPLHTRKQSSLNFFKTTMARRSSKTKDGAEIDNRMS
jgi:hypothetical protein